MDIVLSTDLGCRLHLQLAEDGKLELTRVLTPFLHGLHPLPWDLKVAYLCAHFQGCTPLLLISAKHAFAEVENTTEYVKQWQPHEEQVSKRDVYDELADILFEDAQRGELQWFDGRPVRIPRKQEVQE